MVSLFDYKIYEKKKYNFEKSSFNDSIANFISCSPHTLAIETVFMFKLMESDQKNKSVSINYPRFC